MATWRDLQAAVAARYARLGPPAWPDPHPGGAEARDEEYSRLTDPERYALVHLRARTWTEVLAEQLDTDVEPVDAESTRAVRITSARPGTLPLVLLERDGPPATLGIAVARPGIVLATWPDCGCDACDRGSDDLLEAIDETVGRIVGGPLTVLRGPGWHGEWFADGGAGAKNADLDWVLDVGRRLAAGEQVRLPPGTEALVGQSWL